MPLQETTTAQLDRVLALAQRDRRLPSVVAAVVRAGELAWVRAIGTVDGRPDGIPATPDTQYRMGSITKTFVAVAVMRLVEAGRVGLADPVGRHLPELTGGLASASVEQLLSHAGGTQAETQGPWWERTPGGDWASLVASGVGARFRAGRRFHYSNVGYAVLGRLVEVVGGRGWFDVVRADLLAPLGMTRTTLRPQAPAATGLAVHPFADVLLAEPEHDAGAMAPAGQLWSTAGDLARWASLLAGETSGLLDPQTLAEMLEPHHVDDTPGLPWTVAHGLGWQLWNDGGVRSAGHTGSMPGFLAGLQVRREGGDGVVVLANSTSAAGMSPLRAELLATLEAHEPLPVRPWSAAGDPGLLELVGTWHWGAGTEVATVVGEHLVLGQPGTGRGARFARVPGTTGHDRWVGLDGYLTGEPLVVVRTPEGRVSHLDVATFRFTRTPYDPAADIPGGASDPGWF